MLIEHKLMTVKKADTYWTQIKEQFTMLNSITLLDYKIIFFLHVVISINTKCF